MDRERAGLQTHPREDEVRGDRFSNMRTPPQRTVGTFSTQVIPDKEMAAEKKKTNHNGRERTKEVKKSSK